MPPEVTATGGSPSVILQGWIPILTICVALLAPLGPAIFGVWIANRNARRARDAAVTVANRLETHTEAINRKIDHIQTNTDGNLTKALEKIDRLERHFIETEGRKPADEDAPQSPDEDA